MHITTIGLDLAKHWFQIHAIDAAGWHGSLRDGAPLAARADRAGA
jgi:hypothetical protein